LQIGGAVSRERVPVADRRGGSAVPLAG